MNQITFPLYDISKDAWEFSKYQQHNVLFENPFSAVKPKDSDNYLERIKKFEYIDANGNAFQPIAYRFHPSKNRLKRILGFGEIEYSFEHIPNSLSFENFREIIVARAKETNNENLRRIAQEASSFSEILNKV